MVKLKKEKSCPQAVYKNASNEGSHTLRKPFTSCCQSGYRITAVYETGTGTLGHVCGAWDLRTRERNSHMKDIPGMGTRGR